MLTRVAMLGPCNHFSFRGRNFRETMMDSQSNSAVSLDEAATVVEGLVRHAGEILMAYRRSGELVATSKPGVDVTTEADERIDRFLHDGLLARYPGSAFLTEEAAPSDLSAIEQADDLWVIDPLDGTVNFTRGHPNFAVSVAFLHRGKTSLGIIYVPMAGKLYCARADKEGAYLNGEHIHVSQISSLRETVAAFDWSWDPEKRKQIIPWLDKLSGQVRQIKAMGSAAADLAALAEGKIDAYLHSGVKPWDIAAAALIVEKAGGIVLSPDRSDWTPFKPGILAANHHLYPHILNLIA